MSGRVDRAGAARSSGSSTGRRGTRQQTTAETDAGSRTARHPEGDPQRPPARDDLPLSDRGAERRRTAVGQTRSFRTSAGPLVVTGPARLAGTAVALTGTVDPVGRGTNWWFEIGSTTAYGTRTLSRSAGSGRGAVAVSETVTGLAPGTEYHARLVAQSSAGTTNGGDVVFRTAGLPVVGRATASGISLGRALVRADVTAGGIETQVWVEFGRGGALTARTERCAFRPRGARCMSRSGSPGSSRDAATASGSWPRAPPAPRAGSTATFGTAARPRDDRGRLLRCTIVGTNGPDRLVGTFRRDVICGLGGADMIVGLGRDDILVGGPGNDYLRPGGGRDRIICGSGERLRRRP